MFATRSRRHALLLALSASLGLAACGGGGSDSTPSTDYSPYGWANVTALKIADNTLGTGASAVNGTTATVTYTLYLYDVRVTSTKSTPSLQTGSFSFKLGNNEVISGFDTGVNGMKVGGKRTLTIPASLAYGSKGTTDGTIPPNAALVFDVELTDVK